jgi:hypothetical protein
MLDGKEVLPNALIYNWQKNGLKSLGQMPGFKRGTTYQPLINASKALLGLLLGVWKT